MNEQLPMTETDDGQIAVAAAPDRSDDERKATSKKASKSPAPKAVQPHASKSGATGDKDEDLKLLVAALLARTGYVTQLNVVIAAEAYAETYTKRTATDADVYGMRFGPDLTRDVLLAECKSGSSSPMNDLLKLAGAKGLFNAERAWYVKPKIADSARTLALDVGVQPIDPDWLERALTGVSPDPHKAVEHDRQVLAAAIGARREVELEAPEYSRLLSYCDSDFWIRDTADSLKNLLHLLEKRGDTDEMSREAWGHLMFSVASLISVAVVEAASMVASLSPTNPEQGTRLFLFGGPAELRQRQRSMDVARQVADSKTARKLKLEPDYFDNLVEVVAAYSRNPVHAAAVPSCLQAVRNAWYSGSESDIGEFEPGDWHDVVLKLAKDAVEFTIRATGINRSPADRFLSA